MDESLVWFGLQLDACCQFTVLCRSLNSIWCVLFLLKGPVSEASCPPRVVISAHSQAILLLLLYFRHVECFCLASCTCLLPHASSPCGYWFSASVDKFTNSFYSWSACNLLAVMWEEALLTGPWATSCMRFISALPALPDGWCGLRWQKSK